MTKFYYDAVSGEQLPARPDDAPAPEGSIEGPRPNHGLDRLDLETGELIPYVQPLAVRLESALIAAVQTHGHLLTARQRNDIFKLKAALAEQAKFLPEALFAEGAKLEIEEFPELPEEFDEARGDMIALCDEVLNAS